MVGRGSRAWTRIGVVVVAACALVTVIVVVLALLGHLPKLPSPRLDTVYQRAVRKAELVATMRINLHASVEAEKSAVLADTDDASQELAEQARQASAAVERARAELGELVEHGQVGEEKDLFRDFSTCWQRFQEVDSELLPMAVQNTNIKAFDLSFSQASEAMARFEAALGTVVESRSSTGSPPEAARLAFEALFAATTIHALQARHIAEGSDERMDQIEAKMRRANEQVTALLSRLKSLVDPVARPSVEVAQSAYADFWRVNSEVLRLSRQNSNVRSLALSLGQKRTVTAECEEALTALQAAVQSAPFRATR